MAKGNKDKELERKRIQDMTTMIADYVYNCGLTLKQVDELYDKSRAKLKVEIRQLVKQVSD